MRCLLIVNILELLEEQILLLWIVEGFEVFNEVVLLVLADDGEDGWFDLHKICKEVRDYIIWNMMLVLLKKLWEISYTEYL